MSNIKITKLNAVEGRKTEFEPIEELAKHSRGEETTVSFSSALLGMVIRIAADEACIDIQKREIRKLKAEMKKRDDVEVLSRLFLLKDPRS